MHAPETLEIYPHEFLKSHNFKGHSFEIACVAFSRDGKGLVSGSAWSATGGDQKIISGGEVFVWDLVAGAKRFSSQSGPVQAVALSPDSSLLAVAMVDTRQGPVVQLVDPAQRNPARVLHGFRGVVQAIQFSGNGRQLLSASGAIITTRVGLMTTSSRIVGSGDFKIWDVVQGKPIRNNEGGAIRSAAMTPDVSLVAVVVAGTRPKIELLDGQTLLPLEFLGGHRASVRTLALSDDGKTLASSSEDGTARIWKIEQLKKE